MLEHDRSATSDRDVREPSEDAARAAAERDACLQLVETSRALIESRRLELPAAEAAEKEAQSAARAAVRRRADVERRLNELLEQADPACARRREALQRAENFRAASAYAATAQRDAFHRGNSEQAQRERLAAARAAQEAAAAEAQADEERALEESLAGPRAELERLLETARELEASCSAGLAEAQLRAAEMRNAIDRAEVELADASARLERLERELERRREEPKPLRSAIESPPLATPASQPEAYAAAPPSTDVPLAHVLRGLFQTVRGAISGLRLPKAS
ncbi:MAG: hypothetical protein WAJ85_07595 [Candidatus Baltobacteraceae bacterium]|jgi:chromosome segregation ATPase